MKKLAILLTLLVVLSFCLSAGGSNQGSAASRPAGMTASGYPIVTDGSVTLRYWRPIDAGAARFIGSYDENTAYQEFNKQTGINIRWVHPAAGMEREQFALMLSSGDLPDIIGSINFYRGGRFQGLYDGVFADLTDSIKIWAPEYYGVLQRDEEFYREVSDDDGRLCFFGSYKPGGDIPFERFALREDVLKEIGIEPPRTIAEWEYMCEGMLKLGMAPIMLPKSGYCRQLSGPFGVMAEETQGNWFYKDERNNVYYGQVKPEFRQYLELMNQWYAKGYISRDFTNLDTNQIATLFDTRMIGTYLQGIVGVFNRGQDLGFTVTSAPYPRLKLGDQLHIENTDIWPLKDNDNAHAAVWSKSRNIEAAVRWLNYGYTTPGALLLNWGVEGLNYDVVNGKKVYNDLMFYNPRFGTMEALNIYRMHGAPKWYEKDVECNANLLRTPASLAIRYLWSDDPNVDSSLFLPPYPLTENEQNLRTRIMTDVSTYANEMVLKFITGSEPLSRFDAYVTTINNMGLAEVLRSEQAAYNRYLQRTMK